MTTRTGRSPHRPQQAAGPTQIERALAQLGIELIPAQSPEARGRMERLWATWQGRLPLTPQGIISTNGRRGQITLNNRTDHVYKNLTS